MVAGLVLLVATVAAAHGPVAGQQGAAATVDGAELYRARCAGCHDAADGRVPARDVLAKNPPSFILSTLRTGSMAPMAEGLSPAQMVAIARYVGQGAETARSFSDIDPKMIWGANAETMPLDAPACTTPPRPVDLRSTARWNGWSVGPDNARFQAKPGLAAKDVPRLKLKWAFAYPGAKNGQATVVGDRLYVTSMSGAVYALDANSGCVHWRHAAAAATRSSVTVAAMPKGAPARTALFFSDWSKAAVAIDADTGKQLWKTVVDDQAGLQMTGAPTYWDGKLFVPISSGVEAFAGSEAWECCKFRGALVALDAVTGELLWKRYTTAAEPRAFKFNRLGKPMWGPSGGAIWSAPTIDARRRLVYVGTSNSYTDLGYDGSDSVMAIDADTGRISWQRQLTKDDNYIDGCWPRADRAIGVHCPSPLGPDFSIGASPILYSLNGGGELLLIGQKSGQVYALDPAKQGAIRWERRLSGGSALGGIEFGMAADADRLYVGVSDLVAGPTGKPGMWALDPRDGSVVWNTPSVRRPTCRWTSHWCHGAISQAVSAIPGIVFAGSYDGHFRAYDAATGKVVWDTDTGSTPFAALGGKSAYGGVMDGAGPTIAGGMVYVHSGYAGRSAEGAGRNLATGGNVLLAYSVDGR